jgi:hypothetical protein
LTSDERWRKFFAANFGDRPILRSGHTTAEFLQPKRAPHAKASNIALPRLTFDNKALTYRRLESPVPNVPPDVRPRFAPHNYHILFEVKEWQAYPVDPFLMRRISGMLFIIETEWELSPLEAESPASMMQGS